MKSGNRSNNVLLGGLIVGGCFLVITLIFIWLVDYEFNQYKVLESQYVYRICLSLVAIFLSLLIIRCIVKFLARRVNKAYCARFKKMVEFGSYEETRSRWFFTKEKVEKTHVVLLLHALGSSPREFNDLYASLEKEGISYFAPQLLGFGIESTNLLEKVRYQDWLKEALEYYDILAAQFDKVSILGNSMGGILAAYVAEKRSPDRLILISPGIYSSANFTSLRKLVGHDILMNIVSFIMPYFPKTKGPNFTSCIDVCDDKYIDQEFQYLLLPFNCIRQVVRLQNPILENMHKLNDIPILLLYGKYDQVTNCDKLAAKLKKINQKLQSHCFVKSSHAIFIDYDRAEAVKMTIDFLQD